MKRTVASRHQVYRAQDERCWQDSTINRPRFGHFVIFECCGPVHGVYPYTAQVAQTFFEAVKSTKTAPTLAATAIEADARGLSLAASSAASSIANGFSARAIISEQA